MNDRYRQLMQQELDGFNSPEESAALRDYLVHHPEARREFDEMMALVERLKPIPMVEAPQDMTDRIMKAIASSERQTRSAVSRSWLSSLAGDMAPWKWRFAISFSAGLAVGLIVVFVLMNPPHDAALVRGVMGLKEDRSDLAVTDVTNISLAHAHGEIRVETSQNYVRLTVQLVSSQELELRLTYDRSLSFAGLHMIGTADSSTLREQPGEIQLRHNDDVHYLLILRGRTQELPPLELTLGDRDSIWLQRRLRTAQ